MSGIDIASSVRHQRDQNSNEAWGLSGSGINRENKATVQGKSATVSRPSRRMIEIRPRPCQWGRSAFTVPHRPSNATERKREIVDKAATTVQTTFTTS